MATYAHGYSGTNIRPGFELLAELTGYSKSNVRRAIRWLEQHGEVERTLEGHRGSAACFRLTGVRSGDEKTLTHEPLSEAKALTSAEKKLTAELPTTTSASSPSGPVGPPGLDPEGRRDPGKSCPKCGEVLSEDGHCNPCAYFGRGCDHCRANHSE